MNEFEVQLRRKLDREMLIYQLAPFYGWRVARTVAAGAELYDAIVLDRRQP